MRVPSLASSLTHLSLAACQYKPPSCDPSAAHCAAVPAIDNRLDVNFCQGPSKQVRCDRDPMSITYNKADGAVMAIKEPGDEPELSTDYILFGRIEVHAKGASGQGLVSSISLVNDHGGLLGFDILGVKPNSIKTNWRPDSGAAPFRNLLEHTVNKPLELYHNYTIEWSRVGTTWYVDSLAVRYLPATNTVNYPMLPMNLRINLNTAGDAERFAHEYVKWAGGVTDYNHAPFEAGVRLVRVNNYSTGKQYAYLNQDCNLDSIQAVDGVIADETNQIGFIADKPALSQIDRKGGASTRSGQSTAQERDSYSSNNDNSRSNDWDSLEFDAETMKETANQAKYDSNQNSFAASGSPKSRSNSKNNSKNPKNAKSKNAAKNTASLPVMPLGMLALSLAIAAPLLLAIA